MRRLATATLLIAVASPLSADPRWWLNDHGVTTMQPGPNSNPDVALLYSPDRGWRTTVFVALEHYTGSDSDIYVGATFDGGCTWCPVRWAVGPLSQTKPRIAVGVTTTGDLSVQVAYEQEGEVYVASAPLAAAQPASLCRNFQATPLPSPRRLTRAVGTDTRPRIAAAYKMGLLHFHAVWQSNPQVGPPSLQYDHDLVGDGSGFGGAGYVDLSTALGETGSLPDVAVDTDAPAAGDSSATVVFRSATGTIRYVRSANSGVTWPRPSIELGTDAAALTLPAVDSATSYNGDPSIWNACAWQSEAAPHRDFFDAALWGGAVAPFIDFQAAPDLVASGPPSAPGTEPSVSVAPRLVGSGNAAYLFWTTDGPATEIAARAALLSSGVPPPRNLANFPFPAVRTAPIDDTSSMVQVPFSNCAWDDGWPAMLQGTCLAAPRPAGSSAQQVSSADGADTVLPGQFAVVFADDRTGVTQVFFKMTDATVLAPQITSAGNLVCEGGGLARADVTFPLLPSCPQAMEFLDRYILYYGSQNTEGTTPDGPFPHRLLEPAAGTDPRTVIVHGLRSGETYHFVLIAEDEARNINPSSFDPRTGGNAVGTTPQHAVVTVPICPNTCLVSGLTASRQLLGAKSGSSARFIWLGDATASVHHLNAVDVKGRIPQSHRAPAGVGAVACDSLTTDCAVPLVTPQSLVFYQAYSACGPLGTDEGPF